MTPAPPKKKKNPDSVLERKTLKRKKIVDENSFRYFLFYLLQYFVFRHSLLCQMMFYFNCQCRAITKDSMKSTSTANMAMAVIAFSYYTGQVGNSIFVVLLRIYKKWEVYINCRK